MKNKNKNKNKNKTPGPNGPDRRTVVGGLSAFGLMAFSQRAPAKITSDKARPVLGQGVASGDVSSDGAVIWSRADRPSKMHVQWSTHSDYRDLRRISGPEVLGTHDFTGQVGLRHLPPGEDIFYRVLFEDLANGAWSAPHEGLLRTPQIAGGTSTSFCWSGDTGGQGFGINPKIGGMKIFDAIRNRKPDAFIHCGDVIYADSTFRERKKLDDGRIWHNIVTPAKTKVAETLAEFRGQYRYNLIDENLRRLGSEVSQVFLWDDHETKNNWFPGRMLDDRRYSVKSCDLLSARARQAFFDYLPIARHGNEPGRIYRKLSKGPLLDIFVLDGRSYRGPNNRNGQRQPGPTSAFFGDAQLQWLCQELKHSKATWKAIALGQPLSLVVAHSKTTFEGMSNADHGPPMGREHEIARVLQFIKRENIPNVAWFTADVHYAAAHFYDPEHASFVDFNPFWEFVAGPLNAATFGPNPMDRTFGCRAKYVSLPAGTRPRRSPLDGLQFFGEARVDPVSRGLEVTLLNMKGEALWRKQLDAM